jgi:hypothetical protein
MKENREMKVLLQIALDNIELAFYDKHDPSHGLCAYIYRLESKFNLINDLERLHLMNLLEENMRPYSFWGRIFRRVNTKRYEYGTSAYWFKEGDVKSRKRYLKYLIKRCL